MNDQTSLFDIPSVGAGLNSDFLESYSSAIHSSGAKLRFEQEPTYENARELAIAVYDAIHETAPANARFAIMTSGGKDSSACVGFYLESITRRMKSGLRFVPATFLFASTGHEFSHMEARIEKECAALGKFGKPFGLDARIVRPASRNTVMVELIGNGFALPAKATNDKVIAAGVANWCVSRVKSDLLDAATREASELAPLVIQVLGARHDESSSRSARMDKYGRSLPFAMCRVAMSNVEFETSQFVGCYPIGHLSNAHITSFVYRGVDCPHRPASLAELDYIYSKAADDGSEVGECAVSRGQDGKVLGGCSGLFSSTRLGCLICLKATNRALKNMAATDGKTYGRLWMLQEEINRHQELVHARPIATKAAGFCQNTLFPRGFTFRIRYRWLVMLLAAEIESGHTQLTREQCDWIERKWARHGVITIKVEDARRDAMKWIREGGDVPCFFANHDDFGDEFTLAVGEGVPLGAFMAEQDKSQGGLNFAHLLGLNLMGGTLFPQVQTYIFEDIRNPDHLLCMVTDTPAILGMRTSTGLINGMVGVCYRCICARPATTWEIGVSDGRHLFYRVDRKEAQRAFTTYLDELADGAALETDGWKLSDFLPGANKTTGHSTRLRQFHRDLAATYEATLRATNNGPCESAFEDYVLMGMSIRQLEGRWTRNRAAALYRVIARLTCLSDVLREHAATVFSELRGDLRESIMGDYSILEDTQDRGAELRRTLHTRARNEALDGINRAFLEYVHLIRRLERFRRAGLVNSALVARIAYIARTAIYDRSYANELTHNLVTTLGLGFEDIPLAS